METNHENFPELGRLNREMIRIFRKRVETDLPGNIKLTSDQFMIMHYILSAKDEVIQQDLADYTRKDKSAVLRSIDALEKMGLVRRLQDRNDRRKNYLALTREGHQIMEQYNEIMNGVVNDLFRDITPEEKESFNGVVRKALNTATRY